MKIQLFLCYSLAEFVLDMSAKGLSVLIGLMLLSACASQPNPSSGLKRLYTAPPDGVLAALSGDAKTVLYFSDTQSTNPGIWRVDLTSQQKTQLVVGTTGRRYFSVKWSPDEKQIAYVSAASAVSAPFLPDAKIFVLGPNGATRVVYGDRQEEKDRWVQGYAWSPNGQSIALVANGNLILIDLSDGSRKQLATNASVPYGGTLVVRWSPDGSKIAYPGSSEQGGNTLWILDPATGKATRAFGQTFADNVELSPIWSNDGKRLLFTSAVIGSKPDKATAQIVTLDTGVLTPVNVGATNPSNEWLPSFSPPGDKIALIVQAEQGNDHLVLVDSVSKSPNDFGQVDSNDSGRIQWSSDGKRIYVVGTRAILFADIP